MSRASDQRAERDQAIERLREILDDLHGRLARLKAKGGTGRLLQTRIDEAAKRYERLRGRPPTGCFCRACCAP